ncbi:hypothetical protein L1049_023398 [Liquidambar formosana]|uniref:F-box associated beta-propeller type 1 domain-containing protein n=1 Tax=Liquidambar formosana TaxID=63359 RepID=A0AAP0WXP2_LIQFO
MFVLVINEVIVRWVVQNHTIGTGSWTRIHYLECPLPCRPTPWNGIFLNGAINWFCNDRRSSKFIVAFDFENERFQVVPPPPHFGAGQKVDISEMKMGILGGSLCISHFSSNGHLDVWVMMDYGVQGSWTKAISIGPFPSGLYQRIKYQNNGEILMFNRGTAPVSYNPVRKSFSYLKFHGIVSDFDAIAHIPSFVSLKDVVVGDTVVVLNVKSR